MRGGTLFHDLKALLQTEEPARLGPERRPGTLAVPEIDQKLAAVTGEAQVAPALKQLIRALIYLWHDHLDEAHHIAQEIETADGSLVHAIMHRREPDYFNSKYWFRRVGRHPSFLSLATRAAELLDKHCDTDLHSLLVPNKMWDPFAFVDAVQNAAEVKFPASVPVLQQVQKAEFECLLENLVNRT